MHVNGFIIQEYREGTYKGVDGSGFSEKSAKNWYLNDMRYIRSSLNLTMTNISEKRIGIWNLIHGSQPVRT